jgi:glutamate formiminotransferase
MQPQQQQQHPDENNTRVSAAAAAAVVHAYADVPYDRSSFHLAGRSDCVAEVAIRLIQNALDEIELKNKYNDDDASLTADNNTSESRHPFVGLVDHVAVMPISCKEEDFVPTHSAAAATAAREIGSNILQSNSINVHYYGLACPRNTPLATVRRRNTSFFNSGGAHDSIIGGNNNKPKSRYRNEKGECTIGTPVYFVENYNIRLTPNVDFSTAKTLTQALRGRNIPTKGRGVPGVEALTLPYNRDVTHGGNVFEVACNLTEPKTGSVEKMEEELEKWIEQQKQQQHSTDDKDNNDQYYNRDYFIEKAYRVGTTEEQCLTVLKEGNDDDEYWMQYDQQVFSRFKGFLGQR